MPILFVIVVIDLIGFGIIIPLLPFYAEYFHASPAVVGLLMATYSFTQFIAAPGWGRARPDGPASASPSRRRRSTSRRRS